MLNGCGYGSLSVGPHACTATLYLLAYFLNLTFYFIHFSLCFSLHNFYHMYTALRIFSSSISSLPLMPPNVSSSPSCIFFISRALSSNFKNLYCLLIFLNMCTIIIRAAYRSTSARLFSVLVLGQGLLIRCFPSFCLCASFVHDLMNFVWRPNLLLVPCEFLSVLVFIFLRCLSQERHWSSGPCSLLDIFQVGFHLGLIVPHLWGLTAWAVHFMHTRHTLFLFWYWEDAPFPGLCNHQTLFLIILWVGCFPLTQWLPYRHHGQASGECSRDP